MQDKLSKHSSQLDLLKELLNLQKDMVIMMLSMLEGNHDFWDTAIHYSNFTFFFIKGNVVNGTIGKQMVDTLVESASNVEVRIFLASIKCLYLMVLSVIVIIEILILVPFICNFYFAVSSGYAHTFRKLKFSLVLYYDSTAYPEIFRHVS